MKKKDHKQTHAHKKAKKRTHEIKELTPEQLKKLSGGHGRNADR